MLRALPRMIHDQGSKVERAAVVSDVRGGDYFEGFLKMLDELEERGTDYRLLFLDASEEVLINRYKETRRRHPLAPGGNVADGIRIEHAMLEPLRGRADVRIDTTDMSASRLRRVVADKLLEPETVGKLAITFLTYGFKHGTPREADLSFDVRFLPNPHYESDLRDLTGLDRAVIDYVNNSDGVDDFYDKLVPLLDYLLPAYVREGKSHLTIGIGCTGGRHRSVVIAEHLASVYGGREDLLVDVVHRDVDKPPRRP